MIKNTYKKGFTIVELVIVIAVIAILAAILIPTFSSVVNKANASAIQSELKSTYTEYVTEASDDEDYLEGYAHLVFKYTNDKGVLSYYKYNDGLYVLQLGPADTGYTTDGQLDTNYTFIISTYINNIKQPVAPHENDAIFGNVEIGIVTTP